MSHFTVLVLNENVEDQLEPYYELECSMSGDELKNDPRADFVEKISTKELEEDFIRVKNEHPDLYYEDLENFANEYHGYQKSEDEETWGNYTNPNSKWDWYSIGGRWTGFFKIKDNPKYPDDIYLGCPGVMTSSANKGYADSIRLCDIDFEGQERDTIQRLEKNWNEYQDKVNNGYQHAGFIYGISTNDTKESYIENRKEFSTYALLKNGEWFANGEMGWWAMSSDEDDNWQIEFNKLIKSLPEDTLLTIVDCHI